MEEGSGASAPFDVVAIVAIERTVGELGLAEEAIAALAQPTRFIAPDVVRPVSSRDQLFALLNRSRSRDVVRSDWALVGRALSEGADLDARTRAHLGYPAPDLEDARLAFFAAHYEYALLPWFGTYGDQQTYLFVTANPRAAARYASRAGRVLGHYARIRRIGEAARFVFFCDAWMDGRLAWRIARERGEYPLVVHTRWCADARWWWQVAPWSELVAEREMMRWDRRRHETVYRVRDARLYDAMFWRGQHPSVILPESAGADAAFAYLDREYECHLAYNKLERLTELEWVQAWTYGGDQNENHAVFYARNPALAARFWEIARTIEPGEDHRYGRV